MEKKGAPGTRCKCVGSKMYFKKWEFGVGRKSLKMGVECADEGRGVGRGYGKWRCRDAEVSGNKRRAKEKYL